MQDGDDVASVSTAAERLKARRLARQEQIPVALALQQILTSLAGATGLAGLISVRQQARQAQSDRRAARLAAQVAAWQARQHARLPDPQYWHASFDGSARPNPGRTGLGATLCSPAGDVIDICLAGAQGDSNEAEYQALIAVLHAAVGQMPPRLLVRGDSRVVLDDIQGVHQVTALTAFRQQASGLIAQLDEVRFEWIPRARNSAADALARRANRNLSGS